MNENPFINMILCETVGICQYFIAISFVILRMLTWLLKE